jgi:DNA-directed RNA polymerase subunit beta'
MAIINGLTIETTHIKDIKVGDKVKKGQALTDGSLNIEQLYELADRETTEEYIINELNKVYELQGASISRKHMELIVKQMLSRIKIKEVGDTRFTQGDVVEISDFRLENDRVKAEGGKESKGANLICGITEVALTTNSWLSSASFQHTTKVLINENFEEFTAYLNKNMLKNKKIGDSIKIEGINFKPRIKIFRKYFEKKFFPFF